MNREIERLFTYIGKSLSLNTQHPQYTCSNLKSLGHQHHQHNVQTGAYATIMGVGWRGSVSVCSVRLPSGTPSSSSGTSSDTDRLPPSAGPLLLPTPTVAALWPPMLDEPALASDPALLSEHAAHAPPGQTRHTVTRTHTADSIRGGCRVDEMGVHTKSKNT